MKTFTVSMIMIFFLAFVYSLESPTRSEASIDEAFQKWMLEFGRTYANSTEMKKRRDIFKKELEFVDKFNSEGNHSYIVGLNQFSDMDIFEGDMYACHDMNEDEDELPLQGYFNLTDINQDIDPPESFDWRDHAAVTPIRNQLTCGCCWAFATIAAVESHWKIHHNELLILSPQQLVDCDESSNGCQGGRPRRALSYITYHGIATEEKYPYTAVKGICYDGRVERNVSVGGFNVVDPVINDRQLMQIIAQTGPVITGLVRTGPEFGKYMGGIFKGPCGDGKEFHSMTIIGYGQTDGESYWLVKNSYGEMWGEKGYLKMTMNGFGENCGILDALVIPVTRI